jgi:rhamnulokinase
MNALAMDLGASSGRLFLGSLENQKLSMHEIHRFQNLPVEDDGHLFWDIECIYSNLLQGMRKATVEGFSTIGIDSFCNDYALLDRSGKLLSQIVMYRDIRTEGIPELMDQFLDPRELYNRTGCQRARFNTLVQLAAQNFRADKVILQQADSLLFVTDLLNYRLCGEKVAEFTIASVSQAFDRLKNQWDSLAIESLGIPTSIFPEVVPTAIKLGTARESVLTETGIKPFTVCTVGHHDTASAVAAIPTNEKGVAYISSGTWSLVGIETDRMITSDLAYKYNIANEGGVGGRNRFSLNVMGLWLIQECLREYELIGITRSFAQLDAESELVTPFRSLINPDDPLFFQAGNMIGKIKKKCAQWNQPIPQSPAEINRCIKESLSMAYRSALEKIEECAGYNISCVYIIGGGSKSGLLNQFTASAMQRVVYAGPEEAAAAGNLCAQFIASGEIKDLTEARQILKDTIQLSEYLPQQPSAWQDAFGRFHEICKS